jgi:hypothetical protein
MNLVGRYKIMRIPSFSISPGSILVGAGAVLLAPMAISFTAGILRSATKLGIRTAFLSYEAGKKIVSNATDTVSEITAEAKSEVYGKPKKRPKKAAAAT